MDIRTLILSVYYAAKTKAKTRGCVAHMETDGGHPEH